MTSKSIWIYKNLTRKIWSLKTGSSGKVFHCQGDLLLTNVEFRVWQGALKALRQNKKKTPCAFLICNGKMYSENDLQYQKNNNLIQVNFFPYNYDYFTVIKNNKRIAVEYAEIAIITQDLKVFIDDIF